MDLRKLIVEVPCLQELTLRNESDGFTHDELSALVLPEDPGVEREALVPHLQRLTVPVALDDLSVPLTLINSRKGVLNYIKLSGTFPVKYLQNKLHHNDFDDCLHALNSEGFQRVNITLTGTPRSSGTGA